MLTTIDDRVLAEVNLGAVFGALPRLAELAPEAGPPLSGLERDVTVTLRTRGAPTVQYTFGPGGVTAGGGASGPTLLLVSPGHLNKVVAGTAQPIPVGTPSALKFLTSTFTAMTDLLGTYLRPDPQRLVDDPAFARISTLLTLDVAARAAAIIGNEDEAGKFSAAHMPDGSIDLEVGDDLRYRLDVRGHRLALNPTPAGSPRAALRFADLSVAGGVLGGSLSSLACVCDGRLAMRGFIPLVDNLNRILDRVEAYLGA